MADDYRSIDADRIQEGYGVGSKVLDGVAGRGAFRIAVAALVEGKRVDPLRVEEREQAVE
jgi:hypothetical protein